MPKESDLLCKDCIYSKVDLHLRVLSFLYEFGKIAANDYLCKKFARSITSYNPVTGHKLIRKEINTCLSLRQDRNMCGPDGKHWTAKHKKDLFKMLTKD